jgi:hypothetical protein
MYQIESNELEELAKIHRRGMNAEDLVEPETSVGQPVNTKSGINGHRNNDRRPFEDSCRFHLLPDALSLAEGS